ncbi:hypothetical protein H4582DRAFT_2073887 [Lactarius indigo]|nr:hypothetical protein H4582DRAFT_2073887 [Lactarius indigo]
MPLPYVLKVIGVTAAGATTAVHSRAIGATTALGVVGFSAAGPVAGSVAAGIQAGIGNVAAGSLFAAAQSVAMGGTLSGVVTAVGTTIGVAGLILLPLTTKIVLGLIGFSAIGPVAGSIAAWIQAIIGNVAAGSLFATLQSIGYGWGLP